MHQVEIHCFPVLLTWSFVCSSILTHIFNMFCDIRQKMKSGWNTIGKGYTFEGGRGIWIRIHAFLKEEHEVMRILLVSNKGLILGNVSCKLFFWRWVRWLWGVFVIIFCKHFNQRTSFQFLGMRFTWFL